MLAPSTTRQHISHPSSIHSPPSSQQLSYQQLPQHLAAQQFYDQKLLHDYLESQQQSFGQQAINGVANSFMTAPYTDFASPAIRIQQSTPTPQLPQNGFSQTPMLATTSNGSGLNSWNYSNVQTQSLRTPTQRGHQRASSSSSAGSGASQFQSVGPSASYQTFSNHLPTPTQTPTQESFMNSNNFNNFTPTSATMDQTMAAHMSMKQALMEQSEDVPEFAHSARQSVSSYGHDSPATPHTTHGDDMDFKMPLNGETLHKVDSWLFNQFCTYDDTPDIRQHPVPKFERTYTDIAADNFYNPSAVAQSIAQTKPAQSSLLSPYRTNANENVHRALQAAQYARSQSPSSTVSRGDSPFRKGSPYRQPGNNFNAVGTAAAVREQNRKADAAYAMKSQMQSSQEAEPKTISPKDALLDYREADEDSKVSLFPDSGVSEYDGQFNGGDQYRNANQTNFDIPTSQSYRRDSWATPQFPTNFPVSAAPSLQSSSSFNFIAPSVQGMSSTSQYRSTSSNMSSGVDQTPEFPAHLTSMESSASEAEPSNSQTSDQFSHKPASSRADSGTYSCTYHGCSQRFETPQKLQKHKREGHRNANTLGATTMTSAAICERNSQAGPHKCERINPTTGKPCDTIFSRPYDLTRHEDTIHNARKQKVRCALCVEEKTFSRNDALTRHMRVVHPEVDFPGKHRRREGNHD
ncbi:hypothetical protein GQ44DRAFT_607575 [Phaeosphaeriaceae sp. PMI808]|nr:hypothetical protein GQ44DRAFT_607575 [Phaeosphaeriaceae sp. PMI808]